MKYSCQITDLILSVVLLFCYTNAWGSSAIVLYNPLLGTRPAEQPWLVYGVSQGTATEQITTPGIILTTDQPAMAGYANYQINFTSSASGLPPFPPSLKNFSFPHLERDKGFGLLFTVALASEFHSSEERAGLSVILLANDAKGIEIAFWQDRIWVQQDTPLFTHGQEVRCETGNLHTYYLAIKGDTFRFYQDNRELLTGPLQNYQAQGIPYNLPNYLFLGDDTSSAQASFHLQKMELVEPRISWSLLLMPIIHYRTGSGRAPQ